jgi:predicted esterase
MAERKGSSSELGFIHQFISAANRSDHITLLLLHGTGGNEQDLMMTSFSSENFFNAIRKIGPWIKTKCHSIMQRIFPLQIPSTLNQIWHELEKMHKGY